MKAQTCICQRRFKSKVLTILLILIKSLRGLRLEFPRCFLRRPLYTQEQSKRMAMHPWTPYTGMMPPVLSSSLICRGKLFTWSSLHPLLLLTSECHSLSAAISGSFRTTSLSFTLGSISMSLERISKARGRYIIQAWSSCPGLILTWSPVGHMLQLNRPSPYLPIFLHW